MSWGIKQNKSFPELVEFGSTQIRKILDIQYLSIILTEQKVLPKKTLKSVLDFGSGNRELERRLQAHKYFSLDPFMPADWSQIADVPKEMRFDLIAATEVFEHLQNPNEVLAFFNRHQTLGQQIYITTPFLAREHGAPQDFHRWTDEGMKTLLNQAGYEVDHLIKRGNLICVISSYLNYALFRSVKTPWILLAILGAPFVFLILCFAQCTLRWNPTGSSNFYLGLSLVASKKSEL